MATIRRIIQKAVYAVFRRFSKREGYDGILIACITPDDSSDTLALEKIKQALVLLARHDPVAYQRLRRYVPYIHVAGDHRAYLATWHDAAEVCELTHAYVLSEATAPLHLASTLVHESTHATLDQYGFGYDESQRVRIERICFKAQQRFARRVGGEDGERLASEAARQMEREASYWSDRSIAARRADMLAGIGVPQWLARLLVRAASDRAVLTRA